MSNRLGDILRTLEPIHATMARFGRGGAEAEREIERLYTGLLDHDQDERDDLQRRVDDLEDELAEVKAENQSLRDDLREALQKDEPLEDPL